jgi:hypothetical protein
MQLVIPFLLGLSWLTNAAYIPALSSNTTEIVSRDVGGFRSVAYFVNWVSERNEIYYFKWMSYMYPINTCRQSI